jgi:LacI family transcriptional regulator
VPEDVSLVGFDDLPSSSVSDPPLTSVKVSTRQIGQRAMEKLSERITAAAMVHSAEGKQDPAALPAGGMREEILVAGELVIRNSVAEV